MLNEIKKIDYILLSSAMVLMIFGILFIYSSGITSEGEQVSDEFKKQIVWVVLGLSTAITLSVISYRKFYNIALYIYIISLIPLVYTVISGKLIYSAARWIRIGSIGFQMSEFVKISVIILLARYLADTDHDKKSFMRFFMSCLIVFIPMGIVLIQPDLGTALVYIAILITMMFLAGVSMRYVVFMVSCIGLTGFFLVLPLWQEYIFRRPLPLLAVITNPKIIMITVIFFLLIAIIAFIGFRKFKQQYFFWIVYGSGIVILSIFMSYAARLVLKGYQLMRLIIFLDPNIDPRGAGWNIIQSVTAIGAGGLTGRGFLQGTQSHYRFLPEQSTDFIFSIYSEEAGFLGGLAVFALFFIICNRMLVTMKSTTDPFGKYLCAGFIGMFSFHFIINVGMTMSIMPITGIPLLFMSYGGSAILSAMIGIGLILSVFIRRHNR
jgi:rod shape determining protein RodA